MEEMPQMPPRFRLEMLAHKGQQNKDMVSAKQKHSQGEHPSDGEILRRWVPVDPFSATFGEDSFSSQLQSSMAPSVGREVVVKFNRTHSTEKLQNVSSDVRKPQTPITGVQTNLRKASKEDDTKETKRQTEWDTAAVQSDTVLSGESAQLANTSTEKSAKEMSTDKISVSHSENKNPYAYFQSEEGEILNRHQEFVPHIQPESTVSACESGARGTCQHYSLVASNTTVSTSLSSINYEQENSCGVADGMPVVPYSPSFNLSKGMLSGDGKIRFGDESSLPIAKSDSNSAGQHGKIPASKLFLRSEDSLARRYSGDVIGSQSSAGSAILGDQKQRAFSGSLDGSQYPAEKIEMPSLVWQFWQQLETAYRGNWWRCLTQWTSTLAASTEKMIFQQMMDHTMPFEIASAIISDTGSVQRFRSICQGSPEELYGSSKYPWAHDSQAHDICIFALLPQALNAVGMNIEQFSPKMIHDALCVVSSDLLDELALFTRDVLTDIEKQKSGTGQLLILALSNIQICSVLMQRAIEWSENNSLECDYMSQIMNVKQALRRWYSERWGIFSAVCDSVSLWPHVEQYYILSCLTNIGIQASLDISTEDSSCKSFVQGLRNTTNKLLQEPSDDSQGLPLSYFCKMVAIGGILLDEDLHVTEDNSRRLLWCICGCGDFEKNESHIPLCSIKHAENYEPVLTPCVLLHLAKIGHPSLRQLATRAALWQVNPEYAPEVYSKWLLHLQSDFDDVHFEYFDILFWDVGWDKHCKTQTTRESMIAFWTDFLSSNKIDELSLQHLNRVLVLLNRAVHTMKDHLKCTLLECCMKSLQLVDILPMFQRTLSSVIKKSAYNTENGRIYFTSINLAIVHLRCLLDLMVKKSVGMDTLTRLLTSEKGSFLYVLYLALRQLREASAEDVDLVATHIVVLELSFLIAICKSNESILGRWCQPPKLEVTDTTSRWGSIQMSSLSAHVTQLEDSDSSTMQHGLLVSIIHSSVSTVIEVFSKDSAASCPSSKVARVVIMTNLLCELPLLYSYLHQQNYIRSQNMEKTTLLMGLKKKYPSLFEQRAGFLTFAMSAFQRIGIDQDVGLLSNYEADTAYCQQILLRIQQGLYQIGFIRHMTTLIGTMLQRHSWNGDAAVYAACQTSVVIICRLGDLSKHFQNQLLRCFGMQCFFPLFSTPVAEEARDTVLRCLTLLSNLAQGSEEAYPYLENINVIRPCLNLWCDTSCHVRAAMCRVIGNLCRHNDTFYSAIAENVAFMPSNTDSTGSFRSFCDEVAWSVITANNKTDIGGIEVLLLRCRDEDEIVRKWATFAIGNASFHSSELYSYFSQAGAVEILASCINDKLDKTQANAVGALGNVARHNGLLDEQLADHKIPRRLWSLLESVFPELSSNLQLSRIILFSLGNMLMWEKCQQQFASFLCERYEVQDVSQASRKVLSTLGNAFEAEDGLCKKYVDRMLKYLNKRPKTASSQ